MRYCPIHREYSQLVVRRFTVGYGVRPMYDTKKYYVRTGGGMARDEVRPSVSHVVVHISCIKNKMWYILPQYFGVLL